MIERLEAIAARYGQIQEEMARPEVAQDHEALARLGREERKLRDVVDAFSEQRKAQHQLDEARQLLKEQNDAEMQEYLRSEAQAAEARLADVDERLNVLLMPRDPNDERDVIVEIQGAEGGQEAALFARDLFGMYSRWAESKGWKVDVIDARENGIGGFDRIEFEVRGNGAYSQLKYEGGVHRVQRVPETESQGRIHTSAATVAVLPEADPVEIELPEKDIKLETSTSTGPGGQSVNTTYSAVRLTHIPTGLVVSIQDEKSQLKNRAKAMRVLRARLYELKRSEQHAAEDAERRTMVLGGNRSEKIRTYNFKENRVTDHRIGQTLYRLDRILQGDLDELVGLLATAERASQLSPDQPGGARGSVDSG